MDTAELRTALEEAGLSQYQSDAYTTLLRLGSATATKVADASGVPSARIYDVLRDLEESGYVETFEGESLRVRAKDPNAVLSDLRNRASLLEEVAEEIETRWEAPEVDQHRLSVVKRFDTAFDRACDAIADAETVVQVAVTPDGFFDLREALAEAYDRGVVVQLSIHTTDASTLPDPQTFEDVATEVRHRNLPAPFLALIDRTTTCFAPHGESLNQYGVLVDDYALSHVFQWYFQTSLWEVWETVYDDRTGDLPFEYVHVRPFVRDVEPLLSEGATVRARIDGADTETGADVVLEGPVTDVQFAGSAPEDGPIPLAQLAGRVSVFVDDGGEVRSVGGWGAIVEDVEAARLIVTDVDNDTDSSSTGDGDD